MSLPGCAYASLQMTRKLTWGICMVARDNMGMTMHVGGKGNNRASRHCKEVVGRVTVKARVACTAVSLRNPHFECQHFW